MKTERQEVLRCSFCNKSQESVSKLIPGPNAFICDECIDVCRRIIKEDVELAAREPAAAKAQAVIACALCRLPTPSTDVLFVEARGPLCPTCVQEIEAALEARTAET